MRLRTVINKNHVNKKYQLTLLLKIQNNYFIFGYSTQDYTIYVHIHTYGI